MVEKSKSVRFTLEMDGLASVIDSTLDRDALKKMIIEEVEERFAGPVSTVGEDRFVEGPGQWHLKGRYLRGVEGGL